MAYALDEVVVTNYTIGSASTVPTWLFSRARNAFTPEINALGVIMLGITLGLFAIALLAVRGALTNSRTHEG
jgi:ABC-type spermidine/putrescine transport system permease subunit II